MGVANMSLVSALLELSQHAEGRRVELKYLRTAVGRLTRAVVEMLREGDSVAVDGRTYLVATISVKGKLERVLTMNGGILGDLRSDTATLSLEAQGIYSFPLASLEDTTVFAAQAEKVIITFFIMLENQRRDLSNAERRVSELLREWWVAHAIP